MWNYVSNKKEDIIRNLFLAMMIRFESKPRCTVNNYILNIKYEIFKQLTTFVIVRTYNNSLTRTYKYALYFSVHKLSFLPNSYCNTLISEMRNSIHSKRTLTVYAHIHMHANISNTCARDVASTGCFDCMMHRHASKPARQFKPVEPVKHARCIEHPRKCTSPTRRGILFPFFENRSWVLIYASPRLFACSLQCIPSPSASLGFK